jgi:PST family polysaccharide transporter
MITKLIFNSFISILPEAFRRNIEAKNNIKKLIHNSGWLFLDKFIRMGVGLIVGVIVARYLGPDKFGIYNYALAFVTLFSAIASFGIDELIIRNMIVNPENENIILGSALLLKLIGSIFTILLVLFFIRYTKNYDDNLLLIVLIFSSCYMFQSFYIIDSFFKSKQLFNYPIFSFIISFTIASLLKIYLIYLKSTLIFFVAVNFIEVFINAVLLVFIYCKYNKHFIHWKINKNILVDITKKGFPMVFALIANSMYMRIDQIMIGEMLSQNEVGLYSAAVRISESWYVLLGIISTVMLPVLVKAKLISENHYYDVLQKVISINVACSMFFIFLINIFGKQFILLLFGTTYSNASTSLTTLSWAGIVCAFGCIWGSWIVIENMQKWSIINIAFATVINILLNYLLIPRYGINGSAIATVVSNLFALFIVGLLDNKLMRMNIIFLNSLNPFFSIKLARNLFK